MRWAFDVCISTRHILALCVLRARTRKIKVFRLHITAKTIIRKNLDFYSSVTPLEVTNPRLALQLDPILEGRALPE